MERIRFIVVIFSAMIFMTACNMKNEQELLNNNALTENEVTNEKTGSAEELHVVKGKYDVLYVNFTEFNRLTISDKGNWDEEILDENGNVYFQLKEENYQRTSDVKELLGKTFSTRYMEKHLQWVLNGEYPMFKDIDGYLCIAMLQNIVQPLGEKVTKIEVLSDDKITFIAEYKNEDLLEEATYRISLISENDKWVIDSLEIL